jgi:hypothetical protein
MNRARLIFVVLSLFTFNMLFAEDVYFKKLSYFRQEGEKRKELEARMTFKEDRILITDEDKPERATYADIQLTSIKKVVYEKSSHPRWKTAIFLSEKPNLKSSKSKYCERRKSRAMGLARPAWTSGVSRICRTP